MEDYTIFSGFKSVELISGIYSGFGLQWEEEISNCWLLHFGKLLNLSSMIGVVKLEGVLNDFRLLFVILL